MTSSAPVAPLPGPAANPTAASARRSALLVLYLTVFVDLLGFGIILPLLPFYAQHFGANGAWVGALLASYSAMQFLGAPLLGRLSDRVGRRPVLLLSLAGASLSLALSGWAPTLVLLVAARGLAGLFGGSIATAQAYIADVTAPENRARYLGMLGASIGLGFVFGPAVGAALSPYGFGTAAFAAAGVAALNFVFAAFKLPESRRPGSAAGAAVRLAPVALLALARRPVLGPLLGASFFATLGFVAMEATFALLGERQFALGPGGMGLIFTFVGGVLIVVQGGLVGPLARRFGERGLALTGALVMAVALGALPFSSSLILAVSLLALLAAGQALLSPALGALVSRSAAHTQQGGVLGASQSMGAAARAVGPLAAGALFDWHFRLPFLAGALAAALAAALVARGRTRA